MVIMMDNLMPKQNPNAMLLVLVAQKKEKEVKKTLVASFGGHRTFKTIGERIGGSGIMKTSQDTAKTEATPDEKKETPKPVKEEKAERKPITPEEKENNLDTNFGRGVGRPYYPHGILGC